MKALSSILLVCLAAAGCSGTKAGPGSQDPYRDVGSFCGQWAKAACNAKVVTNCGAASTDACIASQKAYCLTLVSPTGYSSKYAQQCIKAVHDDYADAQLTATEYATVTSLAAPCDQLEKGPGASGASCTKDRGCDTLEGLHCIVRPGDITGTCYVPEVQQGGYPCDQPQDTCDTDFYCENGVCTHGQDVGKACSDAQPCVSTARCVSGTCQAKGQTGASCQNDSFCQSNICEIAAGSTSGVCVASVILGATEPLCTHLR